MRTVHFGTFDAESHWRPHDLAQLPAVRIARGTTVATMDEVLAAGCEPGDLLITRHPVSETVLECLAEADISFDHYCPQNTPIEADPDPLERMIFDDSRLADLVSGYDRIAPYAVLPDTAKLFRRWNEEVPPVEIVARVNGKTWSNTLVHSLGLPGPGRVVRSVDELSRQVRSADAAMLVKDPYGVSGRGIIRIDSLGVLNAIERVLRRQVSDGLRVELLVQPNLPRRRDFSGHLYVDPGGAVRFLGVQVMVNRGFRHVGSGPADAALLTLLAKNNYQEVLETVGAALATEGYWGPVGIDSMVLDDDTVVPVLEINARSSLGLLSLVANRRAASTGLSCQLWQLGVTLRPDQTVEHVVAALRRVQLLYRGGQTPGVVILGDGSLGERDGRLYGLSYCRLEEAPSWLDRVAAALTAAGIRPRAVHHAA